MSGHTPGPWWYQEKSDAYTHIIRAGENRYLGSFSQSNSPEVEANARLAASAPDLLEALKDAIQHCAWCDGTGKEYTHEDEAAVGCSPGSSEISCSHCKDWRKVLAKAEET